MLGSLSEADDAVQDAWLRLSHADTREVENLRAWLTTIAAHVALNMLRGRKTRREQPLDVYVPDPIVDPADGIDPEHEALLADSVGLALLVVLETLSPAERLAFVLHDMFGVPFEERQSSSAPRGDASAGQPRPPPRPRRPRPRRRLDRPVRGCRSLPRRRDGDFDALVAVLDPDVVLRGDAGGLSDLSRRVQGARAVASQALYWSQIRLTTRRALGNGAPETVSFREGKPFSVGAFQRYEREDRRDRLPRRPRTNRPVRPDSPRRLGGRMDHQWSPTGATCEGGGRFESTARASVR